MQLAVYLSSHKQHKIPSIQNNTTTLFDEYAYFPPQEKEENEKRLMYFLNLIIELIIRKLLTLKMLWTNLDLYLTSNRWIFVNCKHGTAIQLGCWIDMQKQFIMYQTFWSDSLTFTIFACARFFPNTYRLVFFF